MWESSKMCVFANCTVKLKGLVQSASTNLKPRKLSVDSTPRYRLVECIKLGCLSRLPENTCLCSSSLCHCENVRVKHRSREIWPIGYETQAILQLTRYHQYYQYILSRRRQAGAGTSTSGPVHTTDRQSSF